MEKEITIDGHTWELVDNGSFYQCRGERMWDNEHDEIPEPSLWASGRKLRDRMRDEGFENATLNHSEKGWCEVDLER